MLNNIKLEPLNPSKSQIIHKNTYYTITKYVHINCKVCTHTDTNNNPQKRRYLHGEVNPKSWTQHLLFICKEEHELRTEREQKGAYNVL